MSRVVEEKVRQRFDAPHALMQAPLELFRRKPELVRDSQLCRQVFLRQLEAAPSVRQIYFCLEDGAVDGAVRLPDGGFGVNHAPRGDSPVRTLRAVDDSGRPGEVIRVMSYDGRKRPWYISGKAADKPSWSSIYLFATYKELGVTATAPIRDEAGTLLGIMAVDDTLARLSEFLDEVRPTPKSRVYLVDRKANEKGEHPVVAATGGVPLSVPGPNGALERATAEMVGDTIMCRVLELAKAGEVEGRTVRIVRESHAGSTYHLMYSRYEDGRGLDWLVLSVVPESDLLDALPVQGRHMLALHGASLLGALLISWLVAWRVARRSALPEPVSGEAGSGHDGAS